MRYLFRKRLVLYVAFSVAVYGMKAQKNEGSLIIKIHPVFNGKALKLTTEPYVNAHQDSLFIDVFKCYLSALKLSPGNGVEFKETKSYHLINADDSISLVFVIKNIPEGNFKTLSFNIGVDSISSVSGALDGDLDPSKGMYWAWNTGYIDAKLMGRSKQCKTRQNSFEYHIGGYSGPNKTLQKVRLDLNIINIEPNKTTHLELKAELAEWFNNPYLLDLSVTNAVLIPGKEALRMAENYADMFQVLKITSPKK